MEYLFSPNILILHVALMSQTLREDTRVLGQRLGLRASELKNNLKTLERLRLSKIRSARSLLVTHVERWRAHFTKRSSTHARGTKSLRQLCQSRIATTPEEEKHALNFTFTMDTQGFDSLKKEFQVFLKKAEEISIKSRHTEVYQLNFDLFKWL